MRASRPFGHLAAAFVLGASASLFATFGPSAARPAYAQLGGVNAAIPFEKYTLDNGLEVILHEDHRTPVVTVNIWYHVGSKDEAAGKNGFAHLFEHVMFQGSRNVGEDMYFKYLERAGASERNGTTNLDRTNYFETVPSNQLALALWLESDRMGFLLDHADLDTFKSQREVVKNERRQNYENAPYGLVGQYIAAAIYPPDHPYHLLTIGTPEDLDRASLDDVRAFFKTYYVPNNATLVVAGDIDKPKAKELIQKYFATLPKGAAPPVKSAPLPVVLKKEAFQETRLNIEADVELPRVLLSWITPPRFAPGDGELDLLSNVLSSGKSSRLYKRLVYDLQIAQDVNAYQTSNQLASKFEIAVTIRKPDKRDKGKKATPPEDVIKLIDKELDALRRAPPTADELDRAKTSYLSQMIFAMERVGYRAASLNDYNQYAGDPGYFTRDVQRYQAATRADLQKAVVTWLPQGNRVVTIVTPNKEAPRSGRLVPSKEKVK